MNRWQLGQMCQQARQWFLRAKKQKRKRAASEKSPWWSNAKPISTSQKTRVSHFTNLKIKSLTA